VMVGLSDIIYNKDSGNSTDHNITHTHVQLWSVPTSLDELYDEDRASSNIVLGDLLIVCAQLIVATQMVLEEKFVSKYNVPALQAVGWEGTFGFTTLALLLIPFRFIYVGKYGHNPHHVLEDAYDGLYQLAHNPLLALAFSGTVISIAFFNFAGISVTKELSATTRMVLDSIRTIVIWGVSLALTWQEFFLLQLFGFVVLISGMCVYNDIIIVPLARRCGQKMGCCVPENYTDLEEENESDSEENVENETSAPIFAPTTTTTSSVEQA